LRALSVDDYSHMSKADRRLLDQFAYRYTRLQDDMGARLMPAVLKALGEDIAPLSAIDRFTRLEQLGWLPSADEWLTLRQVRNQFAHDYPDSPAECFERLQAATQASRQLLTVMAQFQQKIIGISPTKALSTSTGYCDPMVSRSGLTMPTRSLCKS